VGDTSPPAINTSLPVPVELIESSPYQLILKSHWSARIRFLGAAPFSFRSFVFVLLVAAVAIVGFIDFQTGQAFIQSPTMAMSCLVVAVVGAIRTMILIAISWATMSWRRGGPLELDRKDNRLVFGPGTHNLTFPLSTITGLQLVMTTSLAAGGDLWRAVTADNSILGHLLKWVLASTKTYQLNLVLIDGMRLNLVNWRRWNQPEQDLTRQLADFLKVPLTECETA
jgi:hypothetical protein